jgi:hypothetical protein
MIINVPVYGNIEFPDSMTPEEIEKAIQVNLGLGPPRQIGIRETIARGLERGVTSDIRGGAQLLQKAGINVGAGPEGFEPTDPLTAMLGTPLAPESQRASLVTPDVKQETDFQRELAFRLAADQNPVAGYGSLITGLLASPLNLIPFGGQIKTTAQGAKQFGIAGAVGGALDPVYEEFQDSRLLNTAVGGVLGAGLGGIIGKLIEKFGPRVADDIINTGTLSPDGKEITTPHFKLKMDENGNWVKEEAEVTEELLKARQLAEDRRASTIDGLQPKVEDPAVTIAKTVEEETLPVLPQFLAGAKPRFAKSTIDFESDIDKALYIVGNQTTKSARHDDYMAFLRQALETDDATIGKLARDVRLEVVQSGKLAQGEAGLSGIGKVDNFKFSFSKAVDTLVNPPDKYLDDFSKRVYNLGAGYRTLKGYAVLSPKQAEEAVSIMQRTDPTFIKSMPEATRNVSAYRRYLDDMKVLNGRNFKAKSFEDFITKGIDADDQIKMVEAGFFDGCR